MKHYPCPAYLFSIYHFHTLDQRDLPVYICHIYNPDAKTALYIACTNSLSIMGFNYNILAYFEGLLMPICSDKNR